MKQKLFSLKKFWLLTTALIAVGAVSLFTSWKLNQQSEQLKLRFQQAMQAFSKGSLNSAKQILKPDPMVFLGFDSGCELVLSVFGPSNDSSLLEKAASSCLKQSKAVDISLDALGKALVETGQYEKAHQKLNQLLVSFPLHAGKAQLVKGHVLIAEGKLAEAKKAYLASLEKIPNWQTWAWFMLRQKALVGEQDFLEKLAARVLNHNGEKNLKKKISELLRDKNNTLADKLLQG